MEERLADAEIDAVLRDRTVRIDMIKKRPREPVQYYDEVDEVLQWQQQTRDALYIFGLTYAATLRELYRVKRIGEAATGHLGHRELDIWRPIFALAHLTDSELGTSENLEAMLAMSRDSAAVKRQEDLAGDEVLQLLTLWKEMIEEGLVQPCLEEGGRRFFRSREVFTYFVGTETFAWLREVKSLTRRLRRIQILSEQKYFGTRRERVYRFDPDAFRDTYGRLVGE